VMTQRRREMLVVRLTLPACGSRVRATFVSVQIVKPITAPKDVWPHVPEVIFSVFLDNFPAFLSISSPIGA